MELTSLADLLDLQEIDLDIDRLLDRRSSLPELERFRAAHEALTALQKERDTVAAELRRQELDLDKAEGEFELLELKLSEHETRLFAGGMSSRETEHMRLEVQSLGGQRDAMETRILGMLDDIEPTRERLAGLNSSIGEKREEKDSLEADIKEEWASIDAEIARKEERKAEATSPIPEDLLEAYEKLRRIKEGVAVAAYENNVCGGCHMALSPAEHDEAFSDDMPRCVHCRRILVA